MRFRRCITVFVRDLVFLVVVIAFFALATVFVAGCELLVGRRVAARRGAAVVSAANVIGLVLAVAVLVYLFYALLAPEKLG